MSRIRTVLSTGAVGAALFATPAYAQQAPTTITASGIGDVKPEPEDRNSDSSIRKAVEEANAKALPKAMAEAREHAAALAAAAGVTLGPLVAVSDGSGSAGFPYFYYGQNGTFGDGHFCGKVRKTKIVVRNGVRRRVAVKGTRRICRVPSRVYASVTLTFSTAPAS